MPMILGGSGTITSDKITSDANGNLGIGTSSPNIGAVTRGLTINGTNGTIVELATNGSRQGWLYADPNLTAVSTSGSQYLSLQTSGGTERMRIDSSGRVTMPNQPRFRAYINSAADTTYTLNTILPFNATAYNVGSNYNTSTYLFTAPVAGYYYFHSAVYGTSSGGAATMSIRWYINGSLQSIPTISDINIGTSAGQISIAPIQHSVIFNLAANDTVGSYCTAYNGTVFRIYTGASIFEGYLLG